jgi:hypothetical protein
MSTITNSSNLINIAYPIAGQDNDSQGFRDNFNNIQSGFQIASNEIADLQGKALLISPLIGTTATNNNYNYGVLENVVLQGEGVQSVNNTLTPVGGHVTIDYTKGSYQKYALSSATIFLISWPNNSLNVLNQMTLELSNASTQSSVSATFTPPNGGSVKVDSSYGLTLPLTISQAAPSVVIYEIHTTDGGFTSYLRFVGGPYL